MSEHEHTFAPTTDELTKYRCAECGWSGYMRRDGRIAPHRKNKQADRVIGTGNSSRKTGMNGWGDQ